MKRRTVHMAFALVAVTCVAATAYEAAQLGEARRVNAAIEKATARRGDSAIPEAQFAHALALARTEQSDAALKVYKSLIQEGPGQLRLAALFNVGNLHMREAERKGLDDPTQSLPLVELAKQSYRDVLRSQPEDWDARYNLERALQLAPEVDDTVVSDDDQEATEEHVSTTLRGARMDLP